MCFLRVYLVVCDVAGMRMFAYIDSDIHTFYKEPNKGSSPGSMFHLGLNGFWFCFHEILLVTYLCRPN